MRVTAIIAEYNPIHSGHLYQIEQIREESDIIVALMSGSFVQRGEPAIVDKFTRAKMAIENGVDLVFDLTSLHSTASAEFFAKASIKLLSKLNLIDNLCFGAESEDLDSLYRLARLFIHEPKEYQALLKNNLKSGMSFPLARAQAACSFLDDYRCSEILKGSNNILAIEYIKALIKYKSPIKPKLIKRKGQAYNDLSTSKYSEQVHMSASAIRNKIIEKSSIDEGQGIYIDNMSPLVREGYLSPISRKILSEDFKANKGPITLEDIRSDLYYRLLSDNYDDLTNIWDMDGQLLNRILNEFNDRYTLNDLVKKVASVNFPMTKIKRALIHIYLNISKEDYYRYGDDFSYLQVLGFNQNGRKLLKEAGKTSTIPIINNPKYYKKLLNRKSQKAFEINRRSDLLYQKLVLDKFTST